MLQYYYSFEDAILAWKMSHQNPHIAEEIHNLAHQTVEQKITSFPNLEILLPFYFDLNGAWRAH